MRSAMVFMLKYAGAVLLEACNLLSISSEGCQDFDNLDS